MPERWSDLSVYWQKLPNFVAVEKTVNDHAVTFLIEPPRTGYLHHCTIQDVLRILELLPKKHISHIQLFVFRQPTVKQGILAPVWGRLGYWSEIGKYEGPGVYLDAQPEDLVLKWGKSLRPDERAELERLRRSGFRIEPHSRGYHIHSTPEAIRNSQLFRTIPHEIGHYVDYLECKKSYVWGDDYERFWELYSAKPAREKEVYANRYADEFYREMDQEKNFPFAPDCDADAVRKDNLDPAWFTALKFLAEHA